MRALGAEHERELALGRQAALGGAEGGARLVEVSAQSMFWWKKQSSQRAGFVFGTGPSQYQLAARGATHGFSEFAGSLSEAPLVPRFSGGEFSGR